MSDPSEDIQPTLHVHEWLAVAILVGLLMLLAAIALFSGESMMPDRIGSPHHIVDPEIDVFIEGEVEYPGQHRVKRGSIVSDLIALAVPTSDADLSNIKSDKKLRKSQVVRVPSKYMTVYLEGAVVTPGPIKLSRGSQLQDLISLVLFEEGADIEKLRKKRLLKDKEVITVSKDKGQKGP